MSLYSLIAKHFLALLGALYIDQSVVIRRNGRHNSALTTESDARLYSFTTSLQVIEWLGDTRRGNSGVRNQDRWKVRHLGCADDIELCADRVT